MYQRRNKRRRGWRKNLLNSSLWFHPSRLKKEWWLVMEEEAPLDTPACSSTWIMANQIRVDTADCALRSDHITITNSALCMNGTDNMTWVSSWLGINCMCTYAPTSFSLPPILDKSKKASVYPSLTIRRYKSETRVTAKHFVNNFSIKNNLIYYSKAIYYFANYRITCAASCILVVFKSSNPPLIIAKTICIKSSW